MHSLSPALVSLLLLLLLFVADNTAAAFVIDNNRIPWTFQHHCRHNSIGDNYHKALQAWSSSGDDYRDFEDRERALALRTDVRIFLTQRALQSFIFLLVSCRDPHTVKWLENTYGFAGMEQFHGTGAFNVTRFPHWDSMLLDLLQRPKDMVVVAARRRGRGQGGWSTDNPHLEERFVEFEIDIEPASLVTRLVSVRQQIATEWVADLDTLVAVNELILESYHDTQNQQRDDEECVSYASDDDVVTNDDDDDSPAAAADDCVSIEDLTAPYSAQSGSKGKSNRSSNNNNDKGADPLAKQLASHAYERKATMYLNNKMMEHESRTGLPSSPQRKGNFDLLALLATQEAVHVTLRHYQEEGDSRHVSLTWLNNFYTDRLETYFDGDGKYGRADDFLQELLLAPPTMMITDDDGSVMELVDPLRIAEDIIEARTNVALEWKEIMETVVPSDHMQLQKSILAVRMGQTPPAAATTVIIEEATQRQTPTEEEESSASLSMMSEAAWDTLGEFE